MAANHNLPRKLSPAEELADIEASGDTVSIAQEQELISVEAENAAAVETSSTLSDTENVPTIDDTTTETDTAAPADFVVTPEKLAEVQEAMSTNGFDNPSAAEAHEQQEGREDEESPQEQWANYLFQQRKFAKIGRVIDRKKAEFIAQGGSEEDFTRKPWEHYKEALHELKIISDQDLAAFTVPFTRDVITGARRKNNEFRKRKTVIAESLGNNPELLRQVARGISNDRNNYKKDHDGNVRGWNKAYAAAAEIGPILETLDEKSGYDAHLMPFDYERILQDAREVSRKYYEALKSDTSAVSQDVTEQKNVPDVQKSDAQPKSAKETSPSNNNLRTIAAEVAQYYDGYGSTGEGDSLKHLKNATISDKFEYLRENGGDDPEGKKWNWNEGTAVALEKMGYIESTTLDALSSSQRRTLGANTWREIKALRQSTQEALNARDQEALAATIEKAAQKYAELPEDKTLWSIEMAKLEEWKAANPGVNVNRFRSDLARKEAVVELGLLDDASELTWDEISQITRRASEIKTGNIAPEPSLPEATRVTTETTAQKLRGLESTVAALQQQFGGLFDKTSQEARDIKTKIADAQSEIEAIKAAESPEQTRARLEEDKAYWQSEIEALQAHAAANPNTLRSPKELLYLGKIRGIENELETLETQQFDAAYEDAAEKLGISTVETGSNAGDERSNLEAKKQELEVKLQELLTANENRQPGEMMNPEILEVQGKLRGVEDDIAALDVPQAQAAETQDPTSEEYGALYNSLKEEYDALSPEEKNSPEGTQLRNRVNKAHEQMLEPDVPSAETQQAPRLTAEQIRSQVESARGETLRVAMAEYAALRAENEHKNEGMFSRIGRKKREEALRVAAAKVQKAKMAIEYEVVRLKREQGLYGIDFVAANTAQANELFEGLLSVDEEARAETLKIHEERAENRSKFKKAWIGLGKHLSTGNKFTRKFKPFAAGAAFGGAKTAALMLGGATFPVSAIFIGASGATTAGIKYGANKHNIDASRAEESANKAESGKLQRALKPEQIEKLKAMLEGATAADIAQRGYKLVGGALQASEESSIGRLKEARGKASKTMGLFALGAGVTGIAAHFVPGGIGDRLFNHDLNPTNGGNGGAGTGGANGDGTHGEYDDLKQTKPHDVDARGDMFYPDEDIKGESFRVESGSGYNRELVQFAKANGHELSPQQADKLHHHLMDKFGHDYIDIKGSGNDVYNQGGDWRLTEAGKASWEDGVTKEAQKWMTNKGLWD